MACIGTGAGLSKAAGVPDTPFLRQDQDKVPIDRNTVPIPECRVSPALKGGKVVKVVDVPVLGCASVWLRCQKEAERWVSDCDGNLLADHALLNRRINAAYAYLYLADRRFQWAGLAAFASKQVGCGLLHAVETVKVAGARIRAKPGEDSGDFLARNMFDLGVAVGSEFMEKELALGNLTLFLDIYPLHRFYMLRGVDGLRNCLRERKNIKDLVFWPEEAKKRLDFGQFFDEIVTGFRQIDQGEIHRSVATLANHEQLNILQKVIYDNPVSRKALDANQFAWVTKLPTGDYAEIQLTLSAQCSAKPGWTQWFSRSMDVHLWNADDRMKFVFRAAEEFDRLLKGSQRAEVERSIAEIYMGGGVQ